MNYKRFLTNKDYLAVITEEGLGQLIREVPDRIPQAEMAAEMKMMEYLDQYYEIEKTLAVGKRIREYNHHISYPANVYFKKDDVFYMTLTSVNGTKRPFSETYWDLITDFTEIGVESIAEYSQLKNYNVGDKVKFGLDYWVCVKPNGFDGGDIRIPGQKAWVKVSVTEWEPNIDYGVNDVVSYDGEFYMLLYLDSIDTTINPKMSENYGLIGAYTSDMEFDYGDSSTDYVVYNGSVYKAVINPNCDKLEVGVNIVEHDPRNLNVITHMTRISVYYLHQLISPTNISETRRLMYEDSLKWLLHASKFKLNPQIPRKINDAGVAKVDFAMSSFERQYNPNEDSWYV